MQRLKSVFLSLATVLLAGTAHAGPVPDVVAVLARAYADTQPDAASRQAIVDDYEALFFTGFLNPGNASPARSAVERRAWQDGQDYWRNHPVRRESVFNGYGYTRMEVDGTWTRGWEESRFVPEGIAKASWWASATGPGPWDRNVREEHVHAIGYVGRLHAYGVAGYDRLFLVMSWMRIADRNQGIFLAPPCDARGQLADIVRPGSLAPCP